MENHPNKQEQRTIKHFHSKLAQAIKNYDLIHDGDRILVGVSGGKDSGSLLHALAGRCRYSKVKFQLKAAFINVEEAHYQVDTGFLADFCAQNDIDFIVETIHVDFGSCGDRPPCFLCSWHRRKRLFELANDNQCNKLALGHHLDDAIETMMINMCYHGSISSLPARLSMFDGRMQLIRPLILLTEAEVRHYANIIGIPTQTTECPFNDKSKRHEVKNIIAELEKIFKPARHCMFNAMSNIYTNYLPVENGKNPIITK